MTQCTNSVQKNDGFATIAICNTATSAGAAIVFCYSVGLNSVLSNTYQQMTAACTDFPIALTDSSQMFEDIWVSRIGATNCLKPGPLIAETNFFENLISPDSDSEHSLIPKVL